MKFYDRTAEIAALKRIESVSSQYAQMTVMTGRRRIGKTELIKHALNGIPFVYFFVGKKSEALLCAELSEIVKAELGEDLGEFSSFSRLFTVIMGISKRMNFTLVLDEFQNFKYVNDSIFSDIQNIWDSHKNESRLNLVICGSIYSKMKKIFDDQDEPLFGRATARFKINPFSIATLKEILQDHNPSWLPDDLLAMYMVTGGVAKYVEQLIMFGAVTKERIFDTVFSAGSYFMDEGKEILSEEFGKEYGNYFSILAALSQGKTTRGEIKSYTGIEAGGYLDKLEKDFDLVVRQRPYLSGEQARNVRYSLSDNFLTFWFRFFYKYRSSIEIGNLPYVRDKVLADYETFSGLILERYFRQAFRETGMYNIVTNYWKSTARNLENSYEIDLVAVNEDDRTVVVGECKRNPGKVDIHRLEAKAAAIFSHHAGWTHRAVALSLKDM